MLQGLGSFVIPVLSGYLFLTQWNFTKYGILKESGYHVLFRSAIIGVILFTISNVIALTITLAMTSSEAIDLLETAKTLVPPDNAISLSLTFLLGLGVPHLLNRYYDAEQAMKKAAEQNGDVIEMLIDESFGKDLPIHFSLQSGKSYIGYVIKSQFVGQNDPDIALIPIASGYRNKDTQELVITTNYSPIIEEVSIDTRERDIGDFRVVIPMSEIISARYFDRKIYDRFQEVVPIDNT